MTIKENGVRFQKRGTQEMARETVKTMFKMGGRYQNDCCTEVETGNSETTVEIVGGGLYQEAH